jgi:phenylalanine-4-hydroxylase
MSASSPPPIPEHLRRFVVEQDYAAYDAVDQAVWRFVLLQLSSRLGGRAHPAYSRGLAETGISVDRIPSIAEMNEKLSRFGWGAVCVDGFVPPRAFQEFQAHGLLPIAGEIRTRGHLVYTPAPDIIHEAAGHAPILPDQTYAAYLRRIGQVGARAFTLPADSAVHDATYRLSEIKEDPSATGEQIAGAEAGLEAALASAVQVSEAARLSRLYWWTAEYGLVGTPADYRLYGAGLLSSLGESHACHSPEVRKLWLDEGCLDVAFDITRPQPQLFVVPDFDALHAVLERVERELAAVRGGAAALSAALASRELATFAFDSGAQALGVLAHVEGEGSAPAWLELSGPAGFAFDRKLVSRLGGSAGARTVVLAGRLASGERLDELSGPELARRAASGLLRLDFASGARVQGRLERCLNARDGGGTFALELLDARIERGGTVRVLPRCSLLAAGAFVGAEPGACDPAFHTPAEPSNVRVPRPRSVAFAEFGLRRAFAEVARVKPGPDATAESLFATIERLLARDHPREWLLRFVMLEDLTRRRLVGPLVDELRSQLERLEVEYAYEQPIASGLEYLARRVA